MYAHQQSPASRNLPQGFPSDLTMGGVAQSTSEVTHQEGLPPPSEEVNAEYALYQTTLRETFQNVINGCLSEASQSLLGASEWLLGHVEDLGESSTLYYISPLIFMSRSTYRQCQSPFGANTALGSVQYCLA